MKKKKQKKDKTGSVRFEILGGPNLLLIPPQLWCAGWEVTRCEWIVRFWQRRKKSPVPESEEATCWQNARERERARGSGESEIVVVLCEVARWWCSECPVESCGGSGSGSRGGDQQQQLRPIVYLSVTVVEPRVVVQGPPTLDLSARSE